MFTCLFCKIARSIISEFSIIKLKLKLINKYSVYQIRNNLMSNFWKASYFNAISNTKNLFRPQLHIEISEERIKIGNSAEEMMIHLKNIFFGTYFESAFNILSALNINICMKYIEVLYYTTERCNIFFSFCINNARH